MEQTSTRISAVSAGLPGRYAAALFDLAETAGKLDETAADLDRLGLALAESAELRQLTENRAVSRKDAGRAVATLAGSLQLSALVANFLGVLAENRRLAALPAILRQFAALRNASSGTATAAVTSAQPLTAAQRRALEAKLKARTGQKIALDTRVDPELLGGLVVRLGSEQIDSSIKTRLMRLGQQMKG